jgi:hypothetical protein
MDVVPSCKRLKEIVMSIKGVSFKKFLELSEAEESKKPDWLVKAEKKAEGKEEDEQEVVKPELKKAAGESKDLKKWNLKNPFAKK